MRRLLLLTGAAGLLAMGLLGAGFAAPQDDDDDDGGPAVTWTVKVTNLTASQPFTAPLWATHNKHADVWSVGEQATNGHALIAEDGYETLLEGLLDADPNVYNADTAVPPGTPPATKPPPPRPVMPPGSSREFVVESKGSFNRLSMLWMLVRTNDGFSGFDSVKLRAGTWLINAYDAGTERNNENPASHPPVAFFVRDQTVELIKPHPGLVAGEAALAWQGPVARVEITRVG